MVSAIDDQRDSRGRRSRRKPQSTGKRVMLTKRDTLWLRVLAEHGPLASSFLLKFAEHLGGSRKRASERLTDLFNEDNTRHGGPYLIRPPQQFHTLDSRYNQLVYDLSDAGRAALKDREVWPERALSSGGPWLHSFMVSSITASIRLAVADRPDLKFIGQHEILSRADTDISTSVPILDAKTGRAKSIRLAPDALFGLGYRTETGLKFRFFAIEADRATEPLTSSNFNRKSALRSLQAYHAYIAEGRYKPHLQLTSPLLVLNVFSDPKRMERVMALYEKEKPDGLTYQLFQSWGDFAPPFRPPQPNLQLLAEDWHRASLREISLIA